MAKKKKKIIHWEQHPSITLVNGNPHLKIFEEDVVEESLPKFQKLLEEEKIANSSNSGGNVDNVIEAMSSHPNDSEFVPDGVVHRQTDLQAAKDAHWARTRYVRLRAGSLGQYKDKPKGFWASVRNMLQSISAAKEDKGEISVEKAFALAKEDAMYMSTEDILRSRAIAVKLIERFKSSCQFAMAQKCQDHINVLSAKLLLVSKGYNKYLTEEQIIDFMTKSDRGIQVEYLRYYPEIIPEDIRKKMVQANLDLLFDNYAVMYYSKDARPVRLLEEEIDEVERERRRDPILFGMIRGCRSLFFVGDWVYAQDDLTLATVEKALGTLPTLKDEKISDSQFKIEEALRDLENVTQDTVMEAIATGNVIRIPEQTMAAAGL